MMPSDAAMAFGLITLAVVPFAAVGGGYVADRMSRRRPNGRYLLIPFVAPFAAIGVAAICLTDSYSLSVLGLILVMAVGSGLSNTVYAAITEISPATMRGRFLGLYAVLASIVPVGIGTTLVPLINTWLFSSPDHIDLALAVLCLPAILAALACVIVGAQHYRSLREDGGQM